MSAYGGRVLYELSDDGAGIEVEIDEESGEVALTTLDRSGECTLLELTALEARRLGVALVNGTAPWAR